MKKQEIQLDYTAYGSGYQLKLPIETEIFIPNDDPVRLFRAIDPNTIGRFRKHWLHEAMEELFHQLVEMLVKAGEIDLSTVFIDGTKIEAQANRYTFVWKKAVEKRLAKNKEVPEQSTHLRRTG